MQEFFEPLTTGQLARLLSDYGVSASKDHVRYWITKGDLEADQPEGVRGGTRYRIWRGAVEAFLRRSLPMTFQHHGAALLGRIKEKRGNAKTW